MNTRRKGGIEMAPKKKPMLPEMFSPSDASIAGNYDIFWQYRPKPNAKQAAPKVEKKATPRRKK